MRNDTKEKVSEQELIDMAYARGAERVTLRDVECEIIDEQYFTAAQGVVGRELLKNEDYPLFAGLSELGLLTICVMVLDNGYTVLGKSACADPANFNEEIGRRLAREDAVRQIWPLMGYALKTKLLARKRRARG
jgi:hypothetical protein